MALNMTDYEPPDFYEFEVSPDLHTPSIAPLSNVVAKIDDIPIEHLKAALVAAAVFSLIFLIAKDAHKAFMRRAHWIPCDFLVLSAFSIQMLNMLNTQNRALAGSSQTELSIKAEGNSAGQYARWKDFLMIHNSRTILCVFTAYVMPSMADRGLEHSWVRWVALVITVFHHVTSEFYSAEDKSNDQGAKDSSGIPNVLRLWPESNGERNTIYYLYATVISSCFILLIFLLACATIAGRSIERIVAQKIPLVLRGEGEICGTGGMAEKTQEVHPHPQPHDHHSCWRNVKIDVNRAGQLYPLHHIQDHSCLQTVEEAVLRAGKGDEDHHHSCWRTVEDAVMREEKKEDNHHSCWRTIEDAAVRGKMAEEENCRRHCHYCWRTVEDAVLKAWIIVRAYSVQPVLARSALSASAAVIVTLQIVITIVGGLSKVFKKDNHTENNKFKLVAIIVQSIFILMAWALINLRWGIAVAYHRRAESDSWRSGFKIEDFWTRHLKELEQEGESSLEEAQSLDKEIDQLVSKKKTTTAPSILLYSAIGLQWLLVSFSKACWLVSLNIFHNELMCKLFSFMFEKHILRVFEDYPKYKKILEDVQMLGESPESLWVANRKSIEQAKTLNIQGNQDGEYNCDHLVEFLINKRSPQALGLSCLEPYKPQTGLKYLCKKRPIQRTQEAQEETDVEKQQSRGERVQFTDMNTKSWKMTAVSLLSIIVQCSPNCAEIEKERASTSYDFPSRVVNDCFDAYSQAWEIIDFVEEADTEDDGITSEAADKHFKVLQKKMKKLREAEKVKNPKEESKSKTAKVKNPKEKSKSKTENGKIEGVPKGWKGDDSIDWKEAAFGSAVIYLRDSIDWNEGSGVTEILKELESCLADIINECLEKTQHLLLLNCRKWALKRDEKRMGKALYAAGKAKAIMEKLAIVSHH
ncbi:hypothetical protein SUGI_0850390 [Cryptomeria japonica]|nr:hypothetical protein SUGI_0850390 [Cryptomeria japonica]